MCGARLFAMLLLRFITSKFIYEFRKKMAIHEHINIELIL